MMSAKNLTLLAGLAAISFAGVANANTESFTSPTVGPYNTDFGGGGTQSRPVASIVLPTFDTTLGTLNSISFTVGGSVTTVFAGQDLSGNPNNVTLTSSANISLYAPPGPASASSLITFVIPSNALPAFPVAANAPFGPQTVIANGTSSAANYTGSFLPFETVGLGSIVLPVSGNGSSSASDSNGNILTSIRTTASAFGAVTYNFTPTTTGVPEPGSVAMLIAGGMTGAGFFIRRRRK